MCLSKDAPNASPPSEMHIYYVTLVRSMGGYCVKFLAPSESVVREHCSIYYGRLWCGVYPTKPSEKCINEDCPVLLLGPEWE